MNFQPGEVVQLNSGGPKMTVRKYTADSILDVELCYFDKNLELKTAHLKSQMLTKIEAGK